ncbi:hypothetical protein AAWM_08434 [Aspergillus awamori]|uniref:Xylanolytic transcriptional activator regulatory domain-containing protein n=1 Tax=Aspergillus awamori TaxID=105351 RepID=A0A401L211_ASPAW|nr:hypothetical protein AAWM_08434 [Aspergillus awamori]
MDSPSRQSINAQGWPETMGPESLDLSHWEFPDISWDPCVDWSTDSSPLRDQPGSDAGLNTFHPPHHEPAAIASHPDPQTDKTLSIHMLQKDLQSMVNPAEQVTAAPGCLLDETARHVATGFDLSSLYSCQPVLDSDHPHAAQMKRAVELLTGEIVGEETYHPLHDRQKLSVGPLLNCEPRIGSYIQACFDSPLVGVLLFLNIPCAQKCVEAALKSHCSDPATVVVAYALLALGCYLIIFADKSGHSSKSRLINMGVECVQSLGLHNTQRLRQACTGTGDERSLKNAFWVLYAMEKADAAYTGRFSIMSDKLTDHAPSDGLQHADEARLTLQCLYGRLCDRVMDSLYSQTALRTSRPDMCRHIEDTYGLLQSWLGIFQTHHKSASSSNGRLSGTRDQTETETYLNSYFLTFLIHGKWLQLAQDGLDSEETEAYERSQTRCVAAARAVLERCSQQTHAELLASLRFRDLPKLAACILVLTGQARDTLDEERVYLRMACGIYSRLGIFMPVRVNLLLELVDSIGTICNGDTGIR